jgi:cobalt-zinc-cadmium efflux system outer membrane protein
MRKLLPLLLLSCTLVAQAPQVLTLDQAIEQALLNNLDLSAARYGISVAQAREITARLRPNPVLSLSGDHLDLLGTGFNAINNAGPNEFAWRTDFILERGGKRAARMNLASLETSLAELRFRDALRRLVLDVETAFVDVQLAKENLQLAQENLASLNAIVKINTERVRTGDLAPVELERSRLAAMQYETAVRKADLELRQAKTRLQLLLGRSTTSIEIDVTGPIRRDQQRLELAQIRTLAQTQRPDLLEMRQTQVRNQADLRLQLAQGRVDYSTGVEYRRQQGIAGTGNSLGFFFSAPLPVFNRNQGEIARAEREIQQAKAQILALEARIDSEIASAWQQYTTSRELLEDIEERMVAKARDVRNTTEYSYRRGEASLVEFLDAQRAFNEIMQSYNEARANYAKSLYLIDSVTATSITQADPQRRPAPEARP